MKTRCKFYVTTITLTDGNKSVDGKYVSCEWAKVTLNAAYSSDPNSENHAFWKASPNGKMELGGPAEDMAQFVRGSYWYIDETPVEARTEGSDIWRLSLMEKPWSSQLRVQLRPTSGEGLFEVSIDNQSAWEAYKQLDDLYRVEILPAVK